jgi:hypothetical protein
MREYKSEKLIQCVKRCLRSLETVSNRSVVIWTFFRIFEIFDRTFGHGPNVRHGSNMHQRVCFEE